MLIIIYRVLVPFQLVAGAPFENSFSVFASDAWTAVWPKELERYWFRNWYALGIGAPDPPSEHDDGARG